jgi:hypothetical protein
VRTPTKKKKPNEKLQQKRKKPDKNKQTKTQHLFFIRPIRPSIQNKKGGLFCLFFCFVCFFVFFVGVFREYLYMFMLVL